MSGLPNSRGPDHDPVVESFTPKLVGIVLHQAGQNVPGRKVQ